MTPARQIHLPPRADGSAQPDGAHLERFEYLSTELLLRLSVRLSLELADGDSPLLFVGRDATEQAYKPLLSSTRRAPGQDAGEWLWRGAFAVPPDLACDPGASFVLRLREDLLLTLPAPNERTFGLVEAAQRAELRRTWPYVIRRGALLFVVTCQLCALPAWSPGGALAEGSEGTGTGGETPPEVPTTTTPTPETTMEAPPPPPPTTTDPTAAETGQGPQEASAPPPSTGISNGPLPSSPATTPAATTGAPSAKAPPVRSPQVTLQRRQKDTPAKTPSSNVTRARKKPRKGATSASPGTRPSANNNVALPPQLLAAQAGALTSALAGSAASIQALDFYRIPLFLLPIYRAAALQYGVPWQILAAINEIETNYGSDLSVSSAGAVGWMQFMPATWMQYGVDALNAGYADPYNPVDAVFAAARYLRAAGVQSDLRGAILAYNHSGAYADSVLLRAKLISAYPPRAIGTLTGLIDAREPVSSKRISWRAVRPSPSRSNATASAHMLKDASPRMGSSRATPATPGSSEAPSPSAAAAAARPARSADHAQLVEVLSAPDAAVVAVQPGNVIRLGWSRELGRFLVLRNLHGDVFTYAALGSIASSYVPVKARRIPPNSPAPTPTTKGPTSRIAPAAPLSNASSVLTPAGGKVRLFAHPGNPDAVPAPRGAASSVRRARRTSSSDHRLPLRVGSVVSQGTLLGRVRMPVGARAGHMRFAIRPAGDPNTIDPRPILANWKQLDAALHPQGAKRGQDPVGAILNAAARNLAHSMRPQRRASGQTQSARAGRAAHAPLVVSAELTSAQWDQLIARIAALPVPRVASKPSTAAISDPWVGGSARRAGNGSPASGR
jgi:soluble lytic murein transglycosylase-like protein